MEYLLKSSAIIAIFYLFYKLVLNYETFFKTIRWFLLIGLFGALYLPSIEFTRYVENTVTGSTGTFLNSNTVTQMNASLSSQTSFDLTDLLGYLYLIGVFLLSAQFFIRLGSLALLISKHPIKKVGNFLIVETTRDFSPFSFFNYIVYNPEQFNAYELDQILKHEKVHARQFHSIDSLLMQLVSIGLWFNPFIWLYKKELEQNLEFLADDLTQEQVKNKKNYQQLLLKASVSQYQLALANNFYNSILKKRIFMLSKQRSTRKSQWKLALMAPILFMFLLVANTKTVAQSEQEQEIEEVEIELMELVISSSATKADLSKIKKEFAEKGLKVTFSGIERNSQDAIIAIKVDAKAANGKAAASYAADDDKAIASIRISYDQENNILMMGSMNDSANVFRFKSGGDHNVFIKKSKTGSSEDVIHIDTDDHDGSNVHVWTSKDGKHKKIKRSKSVIVEIDEDGNESKKEVYKIRRSKGGEDDVIQFIDEVDDKDTKTVILVNGKKVTKKQLKKMDKKDIKTIEIKKEKKKKKN